MLLSMTETIRRHFTATGYVANQTSVLLHWHRKLKLWLPPGGHIEENEDPVQAVIREAKEETGLDVVILPSGGPGPFDFDEPGQVQSPVTILIEDIDDPVDGFHHHLDRYQADRTAALQLVSVGEQARDETLDIAELASYTMVANLILNLDRTITKE